MELVMDSESLQLYRGDCREVMAGLPDNSVDAIVTDPPYELGFMGKGWDSSGIAYDPEVWAQAFRVLKPGGHALVFGGTRTWHRVAVAIEDAGFQIRDSIAWLYGQGYPKSLNVAKAIASGSGRPEDIRRLAMGDDYTPSGRGRKNYDSGAGSQMNGARVDVDLPDEAKPWEGWGTALKPAFEPVVVARKPLEGTVAANVLAFGTGALNIDASRIGDGGDSHGPRTGEATARARDTEAGAVNIAATPGERGGSSKGRFPANVILDESQADALDSQAGTRLTGSHKPHVITEHSANTVASFVSGMAGKMRTYRNDSSSGPASRFFYVAKAGKDERPVVDGHQHATVKPLALMRYLVTLVTPPGGTVLEPFAGSGTTLEAAVVEGFNAIGIELDEDGTHIPLIQKRMSKPIMPVMF